MTVQEAIDATPQSVRVQQRTQFAKGDTVVCVSGALKNMVGTVVSFADGRVEVAPIDADLKVCHCG